MKQLIITVIFAIISLSITSTATAQTRWSKTKMDSVHAALDSLDDNATITMGQLRQAMTYLHYKTLNEGHKEYVSMPKHFKNGVANQTLQGLEQAVEIGVSRFNAVEAGIVAVEAKANSTDQRVDNIEDLVSTEDALDDGEFTDRQKEILAQIRDSVAKRNETATSACRDGKGCNHKHY